MADFDVRLHSGTSIRSWSDPADGDLPSRLNPRQGHPLKMVVGTVGTPIVMRAMELHGIR